jgi:hypothetical protein
LSGTFYVGPGEKWDESKLKAYPWGFRCNADTDSSGRRTAIR